MWRQAFLLILLITSVGCGGPSQPPTATPPRVLRLLGTPSLAPFLRAAADAYRDTTGVYIIVDDAMPGEIPALIRTGGYNLAFVEQPDDTDGLWGAWVGVGAVIIAVHPDNRVETLAPHQIRSLFSGRVASWSELGGSDVAPMPIVRPDGTPAEIAFRRLVMTWGEIAPTATLAFTANGVIHAVLSERGAVAYLLSTEPAENIRIVPIEGESPSVETIAGGRYPLTYPIIALAPSEPGEPEMGILTWLQGEDGLLVMATYGIAPP